MLHNVKQKNSKKMGMKAVRWQVLTIAFLTIFIAVFCMTGTAAAVNSTLTITSPIANGTVVSDPVPIDCEPFCIGVFDASQNVKLTATPDTGYEFVNWTGAGASDFGDPTSPTQTFTMGMGNRTVTANFAFIEYTLTTNMSGGMGTGSVSKVPDQPTYHYGDTVTLTANPGTGDTFASWSGDLTGIVNPSTITIDGPKTVTANFAYEEYTLTTNMSGGMGTGSVSKAPDQPTYHYGDTVTLTANPGAGETFASWSGDLTGIVNPSTITIDGPKTVTANFVYEEYTLTTNMSGGMGTGSVSKAPDQPTYHYGDTVTLTVNPGTGETFASWSGDLTGIVNPSTITIDGPKTVTANFAYEEYTLTTNMSGGMGTGSVSKAPDQPTYHYGDTVTLTANPGAGETFASWSGDLTGIVNPSTITIDGPKTVTANFVYEEYTLTTNMSGGMGTGSVSKAPDQPTYHYGDTVTLTANPVTGETFASWSGDLTGIVNPSTITIDGPKTVTANFVYEEYTLTTNMSGGMGTGSVSKAPDQPTYHYGDTVTLTANPGAGETFASWSGDLTGIVNPSTITIDGPKTVTANFVYEEYTLTTNMSGGMGTGSVSKAPDQPTYHYGDTVTLTANPGTGETFASWSGDLTGIVNPSTITIDGPKTVTANFAYEEYTLTTNMSGGMGTGSVSKAPDQPTYHYGDTVTLTANPGAGETFASWSGDLTGIVNPSTITIDGPKTVTANFAYEEYTLTTNMSGGMGTGSVSKAPDQPTYHYGDTVTLTANPGAGETFASWSGDLTGITNPDTITIDANKSVTANFNFTVYTLTTSQVGNGTVTASTTYIYDDGLTISATPNPGWVFVNWTGDISNLVNPNAASTTIKNPIYIDTAVTANFQKITYTLTISVGSGSGTVAPATGTNYVYDDGLAVIATPDPCWEFVNWTGTGAGNLASATAASTTIIDPTATDTEIAANFQMISQTLAMAISTTGSADGTVMPDVAGSPHTFTCGTDVPISAIPDPGSVFVQWTGDVAETLLASTTVLMNSNKTVTAVFAENTLVLSLGRSGDGSVSAAPGGSGPGIYEDISEGTVVDLNAIADAGWTFDYWEGGVDGDPNTAANTVTMDSDRVITAFFTKPGLDPDVDNDGDGYTINNGDCNDTDATIHPGAFEICQDSIDQDCNGLDVSCSVDNDLDGYTVADGDCNDNDAFIYPTAPEICGDTIDQDCDGSDPACTADDTDDDGDGYTENMGDCDDGNAAIHPGAKEICGNGVDEDCYDDDRPCGIEETCVDISDNPLETQIQAAPANIMFLMDDSGSMADEIMSGGGVWPSGWETRFSGANAMYYNPNSIYIPWPNHQTTGNLPDADLDIPKTYPVDTNQHISQDDFDINANPYLNSLTGSEYISVISTGWFTCADAVRIQGADAATAGIDVIVDNKALEFMGTNGTTAKAGGGWYDGDYYLMGDPGSARWYLPVPKAGSYTVSVYLNPQGYFVDDAIYQIYSNDIQQGSDITVNQQTAASDWTTLGDFTFGVSTPAPQTISYASYFVWNDDNTNGLRDNTEIYLVTLNGSGTTGDIIYYKVHSDVVDTRVDVTDYTQLIGPLAPLNPLEVPPGIITGRTYAEERQNFVNWFAYSRTRDMMAKTAVSRVIENMENVNIGILSIQQRLKEPVLPINVPSVADQTDTLLTGMYNKLYPSGWTPLRVNLFRIGQYFEEGVNVGALAGEPFAAAADGGACQQNFTIVMTDGGYNGTAPTLDNNDGDNDTLYDGGSFADAYEKTLADVAMHFYERDLSPTLDNLVPTNSADGARHQHMVTYMISFGIFGTIDPAAWPDCPSNCPTWPEPDTWQTRIDDMLHGAVNGRGEFLSTGSPQELVDALSAIMNDILQRIGSGSSISINSQELHSNTVIYQGLYDTKNWSGDIFAFDLDDQGNVQTPAKWSAQERIDLQHWDTGRQIITFDATSHTGIPFRYADIPAAQRLLLNADAGTAEAMVDYLRGDDSNEQPIGLVFRSRSGKLGDIVHSTPLLLGDLLYVGSNDGMLHAFDKDTGDERFAYVPGLVYKKLSALTTPNPGYTHKYFIDQAPYAARVGTSDLLVGTLGKGGKGLYCLDVTTTANAEFNAGDMVKWEYPDSTDPDISPDPDMGYGFSRAFIVDSNLGSKVVILGNGYESADNKAVLYILDAATGLLLKKIDTGVGGIAPNCNGLSTPVLIDINMDQKVDYAYAGDLLGNLWKFDLTDPDPANWAIAYTDGIDWQPLFQARNEQGFRQPITMQPDVMRACDAKTGGYMVTFGTGRYIGNADFLDTSVQTVYGIWDWQDAWIAAGHSGSDKYLGSFGPTRLLSNLDLNGSLSATAQAATLLEQTQIFFGSALGEEFRVLSDNDIDWFSPGAIPADDTGSHVGWYFDLPATGERAVMDVFIRDNVLNSITTIPSNSPCGAGGKSFIMSMDACVGGMLGTPFFDVNGDGILDMNDMINIGSPAKPIWVVPSGMQKTGIYYTPAVLSLPGDIARSFYSTSTGTIESGVHRDETTGLFSWREIE